jgi:hypothetical protein
METKEYRSVDKSTWIRGEWKDEPDKIQWPDPATGLPCLIVRGPSGALCGYVGVPASHPWHGKGYDQALGEHLEHCTEDSCWGHSAGSHVAVHGGLTFSDACGHGTEDHGICHVPGPGEPDNVWWFGFDCSHSGDLCPKYAKEEGVFARSEWESYKSVAYVKNEVTELARQLAAVQS